ncbi:hypothetical protein TVAG_010750 [Trichomonas vaginalis G3]|uniref:Uncharacterized protein n=1 Tax=Trichomonas vaginalis (strain ATCC PRA-98 / G3) TaxID=412133 RepID=A2DP02_TRIV3|nr:hypothetical protein TVAGG3_0989830 [Trichomonas vaginalis G3]EAY17851.1 hypothetical protein TVAG_010750 [Trichomonas vaginalis G3]KAI5489949.1 hypothetical protein TVAGG3_0989830 [Trichomonas vaginalis G3]|eukprot:XP_001329986.1 hypothetical protein [Trichomonas vaginalis G3]
MDQMEKQTSPFLVRHICADYKNIFKSSPSTIGSCIKRCKAPHSNHYFRAPILDGPVKSKPISAINMLSASSGSDSSDF